MKLFDIERWVFRFNIVIIGVIFVFLTPTTQIIAYWYPGKKDILWLFPLIVTGVAAGLWLILRLSIPTFIEWGIFRDRRRGYRDRQSSRFMRGVRMVTPIVIFVLQMLFLTFMALCLIAFMRNQPLETVMKNLP